MSRGRGAEFGEVRIIGGRWRGSKLPVPLLPGLRPTSDRVRETLFNWLQGDLHGSRVLDAFAGSGALGFEAASRGAAQVLLVERDARVAESLRQSALRLHAETIEVRCADLLAVAAEPALGQFDGVFLDPPFAAGIWPALIALLPPLLQPHAFIYLECAREQTPEVPADWQLHRDGHTREVRYALYRRRQP